MTIITHVWSALGRRHRWNFTGVMIVPRLSPVGRLGSVLGRERRSAQICAGCQSRSQFYVRTWISRRRSHWPYSVCLSVSDRDLHFHAKIYYLLATNYPFPSTFSTRLTIFPICVAPSFSVRTWWCGASSFQCHCFSIGGVLLFILYLYLFFWVYTLVGTWQPFNAICSVQPRPVGDFAEVNKNVALNIYRQICRLNVAQHLRWGVLYRVVVILLLVIPYNLRSRFRFQSENYMHTCK